LPFFFFLLPFLRPFLLPHAAAIILDEINS
jgi:hypothetical protein